MIKIYYAKDEKNMKGMIFKRSITAISIVTLMLMMFSLVFVNVQATIEPAISYWVDPATVYFTAANATLGQKFNVTIWINTEVNASYLNTFSWQAKLTFNSTLLNATKALYTGGTTSAFFSGHATIPLAANIDNVQGFVLIAEGLLGSDTRAPANASLFYLEFEIMAEPDVNSTLTCGLDFEIANCVLLDADLTDHFAEVTFKNGTYTFAPAPPDTTPPTIANPTQTPVSPVNQNTSVAVSANITDGVGGSGVKNATLSYTADNLTWTNVTMALSSGVWTGTIPGQVNGTTVQYKIIAYDVAENVAVNDNNSIYYSYYVFPELTGVLLVVMLMLAAGAIVAYRKKSVKLL
jgi:hypothetical protein